MKNHFGKSNRRAAFAALSCMGMALQTATALAEAPPAEGSADMEEFSELLTVMSEETSIATKTKMNSDFVPGIVTVLDGKKMAALGARTVFDALDFVPGVDTKRDRFGIGTLEVRGIPYFFNNGGIQILLNDVPVSRDSAGINSTVLDMPIEQIERLEFVRGPGSVVYGEFALQGLLNIVTRNDENSFTVSGDDRKGGGIDLRLAEKTGAWKAAANYSTFITDDLLRPASPTPLDSERQFALLSLAGHGLTVRAQGIERDQPNPGFFEESSRSLQADWQTALSEHLDFTLRSQYMTNDITQGNSHHFEGEQLRSAAEIQWRGWPRQQWLAGVDFRDGRVENGFQNRPTPPNAPPGTPPPPTIFIGTHERQVLGFVLQNQLEIAETVQATLGLRHDDNSEVASRQVTPRAALAWRAAPQHVFKLQYAEGYRSPNYFELYASPPRVPLDPEVNSTTEINYIYQKPDTTVRVTVFQSRIDDMIYLATPPPGFDNKGDAETEGLELEWNQRFGHTLRLDMNASMAESEQNRNPAHRMRDTIATPDWLASAGVLWTPQENNLFGLHWHHIGPRAAIADDEADIVDVAYTRRHAFVDSLQLQVGIANLFDSQVTYVTETELGTLRIFNYEYRTVWAAITLEF